jgi:DNA-binding NarL/FixJ family response regulator
VKLLIIDDANAVRPRLEKSLGEIDGIDVSSCSPREAGILQRMLQLKPDVVVIDIRMPGSGIDLMRRIKSGSHPPVVIALSTSSSLQYRAACHRAGAEYFFDKVREQARLVEAIADLQKELVG